MTSRLLKSCTQSAAYQPEWRGTSLFSPHKDNPGKEVKDMSKMSDMAQTIEELKNAAAVISDAADYLSKMFSGEAPAKPRMPQRSPRQSPLSRLRRSGAFLQTSPVPATPQRFASFLRSMEPPSSPRSTQSTMKPC